MQDSVLVVVLLRRSPFDFTFLDTSFFIIVYDATCASCMIGGSMVVSISACHAEDRGSIPGRVVLFDRLSFADR